MGTRRPRREERKEETRQDLLDSAVKVFAERGFHGASLQEIAADAGYTTGAIYWHFGGKDELFLAAFEAFAITRVGEFEAIGFPAEAPLPQRARQLADQWMERQANDPRFLVVALEFAAHAWRNPALREDLATRAAAMRLAVERFIEREAHEAEVALPMPAADIATALRELGVGLALAKLADPEAFADRLYGDFVELFWRLVLRADAVPDSQRTISDTGGNR